jgi:hypothetical protein
MSQMTATATAPATARVAPRPLRTPARTSTRPRLRVVDAAPLGSSHVGYGMLCASLVIAGLLLMLVLNTVRAEGSFVLSDLRADQARLEARQVSLESELAELRSPASLSRKAEGLGMVRSPSTAVLRLSDGVVLGVAAGVDGEQTFTVDLPAPGSGEAVLDDLAGPGEVATPEG